MKKTKIYFAITFIFIALIFVAGTKSNAASLLWPIGGENASETYIEYKYENRTYKSQDYIDKCKRDYNMDVYEVYYYQNNEHHYGVDIFGKPGETYSVVAVKDGTILGTSANYIGEGYASTNYINRNQRRTTDGLSNGGGYGNFVALKDDETGKCYFYAHLQAGTITVKQGDKVKAGQELGKMGSSGDSGHMHLHFEVRKTPESLFLAPYTYTPYHFITITTGYNIETENPIDYIGNGPLVEEQKENNIPEIASKEELKKIGDLNADGKVDLGDAVIILKLAVNRMIFLEDGLDYADEFADVNKDEKVSILDAQMVLEYTSSYIVLLIDPNTTPIEEFCANR